MTTQQMDVEVLVVGGGQAGIAMSEHLTQRGIPHLVVEKSRIAEAWRSRRWDSLVANGPAWHDRFPGMTFPGQQPGSFVPKAQIADYFVQYAEKINAPLRTGVAVHSVVRNPGRPGFPVETSAGRIDAQVVVAATGPFQTPLIPRIAPADPELYQIHSACYFNPQQLNAGGVLVVGAGSSGVQIADELQRAGKTVCLSVGPHERPPRTYRQRDFCWWLGTLGLWDAGATAAGDEHVTIAVSGAHGGYTVDFRVLAAQGVMLAGRTRAFENGRVSFLPDLADNIRRGDESYLALLDAADAWIARNGLDLPEEPAAREFLPLPACVTSPLTSLDLADAGISNIIWATGYTTDYRWLQVNAFDTQGNPQHQRGISSEPGVYFLGLPWLSRRGSSFIWGVWHDAQYIADHIATRRTYSQFQP